jgi:hypothetical protein
MGLGTMGFLMASVVVNEIASDQIKRPSLDLIPSNRSTIDYNSSTNSSPTYDQYDAPTINNNIADYNRCSDSGPSAYNDNAPTIIKNTPPSTNLSTSADIIHHIHDVNDVAPHRQTYIPQETITGSGIQGLVPELGLTSTETGRDNVEEVFDMADSHCHLQLDPLFGFVDMAIQRAIDCRVKWVSEIHTSLL